MQQKRIKLISVVRFFSSENYNGYTKSGVFVDGSPWMEPTGSQICGLEDEPRLKKVMGETRIPAGTYPFGFEFSPKFGRELLTVFGVTDFTGVRWHSGNTEDHTDACYLPGNRFGFLKGMPAVLNSQRTLQFIEQECKRWIDQGYELFVCYIDQDKGIK